jgi:hypothetical protein
LTKEKKTAFFNKEAPVVDRNDTLKSHFGGSQAKVHFFVSKGIIDIIIGEMLFHPDDSNDEVTKERALAIFENVARQKEDEQSSDLQTDVYHMIIKNPAWFQLVVNMSVQVHCFVWYPGLFR